MPYSQPGMPAPPALGTQPAIGTLPFNLPCRTLTPPCCARPPVHVDPPPGPSCCSIVVRAVQRMPPQEGPSVPVGAQMGRQLQLSRLLHSLQDQAAVWAPNLVAMQERVKLPSTVQVGQGWLCAAAARLHTA